MGACNEPGCTSDTVEKSTRCLEHRDLIDTEVMALGDPPPNEFDDYGDHVECWNCGGEGALADCFDGMCVDAEEGCDDCMRRCDVCEGKGGWPREPEPQTSPVQRSKDEA